MPFGAGVVVDGALREGEAVMDAGIELDLGVDALQRAVDLVDHLLRRLGVGSAQAK